MSDHPQWTVTVREMIGLVFFIYVVGNVIGSWPGHPGLLQWMFS